MLFNSIDFLIFFPIVTIGYFLLSHKQRWWWLLGASCAFYMTFRWEYIFILGGTIVIDYIAGIYIEKSEGKRRLWFLIMSLVANIGVLAFFKYYNFGVVIIADYFGKHYDYLGMALPIGLSFHTFQAMSYTIEVYRGKQKAEHHFGFYALYVMFYPQLVAGPIERPQNVLPQFYQIKIFDYKRIVSGLQLMAWGLFKKVVIADRLALFVGTVYKHPLDYEGLPLLLATFFFSFQIFCDFSGYSDIALGAAEVMGFKLMKNFDRPYFSKTISEFWSRWHISLSTWFRDYLYIPLGGNRVGVPRWYFNLFIVFLLSGLWHGANWNFIIWGALHGFYLIFALITAKPRNYLVNLLGINKLPILYKFIQAATTFVLVAFAWIFFRGDYLEQKWNLYIVKHLFTNLPSLADLQNTTFQNRNVFLGQGAREFALALALILFMEIVHYFQRNQSMRDIINRQKTVVRWVIYYFAVMLFLYLGVFDKPVQFIYFQF